MKNLTNTSAEVPKGLNKSNKGIFASENAEIQRNAEKFEEIREKIS